MVSCPADQPGKWSTWSLSLEIGMNKNFSAVSLGINFRGPVYTEKFKLIKAIAGLHLRQHSIDLRRRFKSKQDTA